MHRSQLLHYQQYGSGTPLVIIHGLYGSSQNWRTLAKQLSESFTVLVPDMRNHGASFHDTEMSYSLMVEDLYQWLGYLGIESCRILGHSMGGKVAMLLAQEHPHLLSKILIADIAPVPYEHDYGHLLSSVMALSLTDIGTRSDADQALAETIPEPMLRSFLLQNLVRDGAHWRWRVNWSAIKQAMADLTGFPPLEVDWRVDIPTLFIRGSESAYIGDAEVAVIKEHFKHLQIQTIPQAGHWLHVEQPVEFMRLAMRFFS